MWSKFDFNDPYEGEVLESINNTPIPAEYINFMKKHNGGEGDTGESWLMLYPFEELVEINEEYQEYLKDGFIIGTNGGGELFGINGDGRYFIVPDIIEEPHGRLPPASPSSSGYRPRHHSPDTYPWR